MRQPFNEAILWQLSQLLSTSVPYNYWEKTGCVKEGRVEYLDIAKDTGWETEDEACEKEGYC